MKNTNLPRVRRGSALLTVLLITLAISALAASSIYLSGNATLMASSYDREREFKYASEAALAIGKSRLNYDPLALPDTLYSTLLSEGSILGADSVALPGVKVNLYIGPSGSTSGQFGRFASVVAEARDGSGARFVRRLELAQESFAKYAYWSNSETNNGDVIYFANGDNLWGPVWSNDVIHISSSGGATFHDEVGTAKTIDGVSNGTFVKGYATNQRKIVLPNNSKLSKLAGYATAGNFNFTAPTSGAASGVRVRLEFVATDLGTSGSDSTGVDEGFVKIYIADSGESDWLRADWTSSASSATNCGASYRTSSGGPKKFFPVAIHNNSWVKTLLQAGGMTSSQANDTINASLNTILSKGTARCYLGGDPHLVAVERNSSSFTNSQKQKAGEDTTFTANGDRGHWVKYPGTVDSRLKTRRPLDADYLFPIYRGLNPGTKGVIYVNGTVGLSGVLRGRITVYATGTIVLLDDMRYATDPSTGRCADILGVLAGADITVADNSILGPQSVNGNYRNFDDTKDVFIHGVLMALNTSFQVENYSSGPLDANDCEGNDNGRGCLYLNGGVIQDSRGPVGTTNGYGYTKRYSYDRCALTKPPPYFPTTGRFIDNRYYEIDPVRFNVNSLFARLVPGQ